MASAWSRSVTQKSAPQLVVLEHRCFWAINHFLGAFRRAHCPLVSLIICIFQVLKAFPTPLLFPPKDPANVPSSPCTIKKHALTYSPIECKAP